MQRKNRTSLAEPRIRRSGTRMHVKRPPGNDIVSHGEPGQIHDSNLSRATEQQNVTGSHMVGLPFALRYREQRSTVNRLFPRGAVPRVCTNESRYSRITTDPGPVSLAAASASSAALMSASA